MTGTVRVVADDVTGATDIADTLTRGGRRTLVTIGVPAAKLSLAGFDAVVTALKTRTAPVANAVAESVRAYEWLSARATGQLIFKVCSTFDSTAEGNIGPVAGGETSGAVLHALGVTALAVGPAIAPGVPWTTSVGPTELSLALKSGNFGGPDFFADALGSGDG